MARMASQMKHGYRVERRELQEAVVRARQREAKAKGLFQRQLATTVPPRRSGPGLQEKIAGMFQGKPRLPVPAQQPQTKLPQPMELPFENELPVPSDSDGFSRLPAPEEVSRSVLEIPDRPKSAGRRVLRGELMTQVEAVQFQADSDSIPEVGFANSTLEMPEPQSAGIPNESGLELPAPRQAMLVDEYGRPVSVLENPSGAKPQQRPLNRLPSSSNDLEVDGDVGIHRNPVRSRKGVRPMQSVGFRNRLRRIQTQDDDLPDPSTLPQSPDLIGPEGDSGTQDGLDDELGKRRTEMSCEEARNTLLGASIRDIALDVSPPRVGNPELGSVSRTWTDPLGRVLGTGTMVNLSRGYVIIETGAGQQKIPVSRLGDADLAAVAEFWNIPSQCTLGPQQFQPRCWTAQTFTWKASGLCHKPLYFQNVQLERYGHSSGPFSQPFYSAVHFFGSLATLPYQMAIHPPNECRYALGYYRPGNCAPWLRDPIPISLSGMRRQALVSTGLAFLP